jgi:tetratricopeptide (TPR) repeat protein
VEVRAISAYAITGKLGEGGMGVVLRARHPKLPVEVAVKVLKASQLDDDALARFRAEVLALARVQHPNVVPVLDAGRAEDGSPFYVMPLVAGRSLESIVKESGPLEPRRAAEIVAKVARAVHAAHANAAVVHRDLKPSNVMIEESTGEPKLFDFGLAKKTDAASLGPRTETGAVLGTPEYMAPEQASGENALVDARTDVYGLGATLYALLTGRPPFERKGRPMAVVIAEICLREPPSAGSLRPDLPHDLVAIVGQAMAKERERRYPSALELALDLERFGRGDSVRARPPGVAARVVRLLSRHRGSAAIMLGLVLLALGVSVGALVREARARAALERMNADLRRSALLLGALHLAEGGAFVGTATRRGDPTDRAVQLRQNVLEGCAATAQGPPTLDSFVMGVKLLVRSRWLADAHDLLARAETEFPRSLELLELDHRLAHLEHVPCAAAKGRIRAATKDAPRAPLRLAIEAEERYEAKEYDVSIALCDEAEADRTLGTAEVVRALVAEQTTNLVSIRLAPIGQALAAFPSDPLLLGEEAYVTFSASAVAAGERLAKQALARDPTVAPALLVVAQAQMFRLDLGEAERTLAELLKLEPDSPVAWLADGKALLVADRPGAALEAVAHVPALTDDEFFRARALSIRGAALYSLGRIEDADAVLRDAIRLANATRGESVWPGAIHARILAEGHRMKEARDELQQVAEQARFVGGQDPFTFLTVAETCVTLGEHESAAVWAENARRLYHAMGLEMPREIREQVETLLSEGKK